MATRRKKAARPWPSTQMIQEFYALRDIDAQGRPSRGRLEEVGLKDVAEALHK